MAMTLKKKVLVIKEILPAYRCQLYDDIAQLSGCELTVVAEVADESFGTPDFNQFAFTFTKAQWRRFFMLKQDWVTTKLWSKHDVILHIGDFKFMSLWLCLLITKFTKKKIFLHGQGGYKRSGILSCLVYSVAVTLCDGYVCYAEYSRSALFKKIPKFLHKKVSVCDNTLVIDPVESVLRKNDEAALFYIGRLRPSCGIEVLLNAAIEAKVKVEVIGLADPEYLNFLLNKFSSVARFYGSVYETKKQQEIAARCFAGAYGGDAGLSIVHYMALGLPVIVHKDMHKHMGPEPSYVEDGVNGLLFERNDVASLTTKIKQLTANDELRYSMALSALNTFKQLASPSMGEKMIKIMRLVS